MSRRSIALLVATVLVAAGCGGGDDGPNEEFAKDYKPYFDKIGLLGGRVQRDVAAVDKRSDKQNADAMRALRREAADVRTAYRGLEVPGDLTDERDAVVEGLGELQGDLMTLERRALSGDITRASAQQEIRASSRKLVTAQAPIAKEAGFATSE